MRHLQNLHQLGVRAFGTTTRQMRNRVPEHQRLFQADNDIPVHIKGGTVDVILYRITMTMTIGGTAYSLYSLFDAAIPKKK